MDLDPELLGPILSLQSVYPAPAVYYQCPSNKYIRGKTRKSLWVAQLGTDRRNMEIVEECAGRKKAPWERVKTSTEEESEGC